MYYFYTHFKNNLFIVRDKRENIATNLKDYKAAKKEGN